VTSDVNRSPANGIAFSLPLLFLSHVCRTLD
jgi:hypothetical protein